MHFEDENHIINAHTLLGVLNPDTGKWETQDPEYDVYWKNLKTDQRTSMVFAGHDASVVPCNGTVCDWNFTNHDGNVASNLKRYTAYMSTVDKNAGERITFYRPDVDPAKELFYNDKKGKFCDLIKKNCADGFFKSTPENVRLAND